MPAGRGSRLRRKKNKKKKKKKKNKKTVGTFIVNLESLRSEEKGKRKRKIVCRELWGNPTGGIASAMIQIIYKHICKTMGHERSWEVSRGGDLLRKKHHRGKESIILSKSQLKKRKSGRGRWRIHQIKIS